LSLRTCRQLDSLMGKGSGAKLGDNFPINKHQPLFNKLVSLSA
jgi:hypothetical protein